MTMDDDQLQIERLIDGELSIEQEQTLLEFLEEHPSGWKQLAVAFLEDRTLRSSLASDVSQNASAPAGPEFADESSQCVISRQSGKSKALQISVACVGLLAAFLSGRYSATDGRDAKTDRIVADSNPEARENIPVASNELPTPVEFISLDVGVEGEDIQTVDVPLVPWEQVTGFTESENLNRSLSLIPAEIRELLARRGQTVRESIDYYQFELADGRVGVIPVSSFEIQASTIPLIQ